MCFVLTFTSLFNDDTAEDWTRPITKYSSDYQCGVYDMKALVQTFGLQSGQTSEIYTCNLPLLCGCRVLFSDHGLVTHMHG